jgi:hypothetical protein
MGMRVFAVLRVICVVQFDALLACLMMSHSGRYDGFILALFWHFPRQSDTSVTIFRATPH